MTVAGEAHLSNTTEISVPAALDGVVRGVARLNDIQPRPNSHLLGTQVERLRATAAERASVAPEYGNATSTHYVTPGDAAAIFNSTPLTKAATPIDGTGVTIAVIGQSNVDLGDIATFRSMFGLPAKNPTVTVVGSDPGKNSDAVEAYLDNEWAGALAPNANINFIVSGPAYFGGGVDAAALYAVDNNIGDIISLSYGGCEYGNGASYTNFWNVLWEQAAAQGQTALVSSGDSGAAGCDASSNSYARSGYGVNALGVSAYNVSVGGSMFVDFNSAQYWGANGTTIPFANALGYIPEAAWNESRLTTTLLNNASTATVAGSGIYAGGGGISIYTPRPSWQTGSGISSTADPTDYNGNAVTLTGTTVTGLHRLSPDVALIAAGDHDGTAICYAGICQTNASGQALNFGLVGGTSVATPVMASAQALINQKNGGRQGNTNIYYYNLANQQYTASQTACAAPTGTPTNPTVTLPAATCNFHDIVSGSNIVPTASSGTAGIGFNAGTGYDAATGLGSINIANVANNWPSVVFNATGTTFSLTPTDGITHGTNQTATIRVSPASGSGTPTGDVSIIASTATGTSQPQVFTLSGGSVNGTINSLQAGTYTVYAHYAGDTTFAASDSAPITVSIGKEDSTITLANDSVSNTNGSITQNRSSFTYGAANIYLDTDVAGVSGNGTPSGAVTYTVSLNGTPLPALTTSLDSFANTYLLSGAGYANYYLVPNYATLPAGNYSVTASYAGDSSFNPSSSTTTFTVAKATPTLSLTPATTQVKSGQPVTLNFSITTPAAASPATGTVTFVNNTTGTTLSTVTLSNGTAQLVTTGFSTSGANSITATYSGDANYNAGSATSTVTVGTLTAPTLTVSTSGTLAVGGTVTLKATLSAGSSAATTVTFYDNGALLGTTLFAQNGTTSSLSVTKFTAGSHSITAVFAGFPPQASATSTPITITIAKNTTGLVLTAGPVTQTYGNAAISVEITRSPSTTTVPAVPLTGVINFTDISVTPAVVVGTATPVFDSSAGVYTAATVLRSLAVGTHTITATYGGDANYSNSTAPLAATYIITKGNPVVSVSPASFAGGSANATLTVQVAFGGVAPTGTVQVSIDGGPAVTATCSGNTSPLVCTASYPAAMLSGGAHTATATITADANYNAATGTGSVTVGGGAAAVITSPAPGATLTASSATFNWSAGTGVTYYVVYIGTKPGADDIYSGNPQYVSTSLTVNGLPIDGSTFYVRLWSFINGSYQFNDYTYHSVAVPPVKSEITSPAPGSTLTGSSATFTWSPGTRVTNNVVYVGTQPGANDLYSGNPVYLTTSLTVNGLPTDGSTIYVRLWSYINGSFQYNDYVYQTYQPTPVKSAMTSPAPGSVLPGSSATFTWSAGTRVTNNVIYVGTQPGANDIYSGNPLYVTTSQTITGLPTDGSTVYVRLWSFISGTYQYNDYSYQAAATQQ